jgi:hypothetical protein
MKRPPSKRGSRLTRARSSAMPVEAEDLVDAS